MQTDVIIIGGGIAGLQAAIQLGRYMHHVIVIDRGRGRSTLCRNYQNLLGWPDGVSGLTLRRIGQQQAKRLGVTFIEDEVIDLDKNGDGFSATLSKQQEQIKGPLVLLATGIIDRYIALPGLEDCLGLSVYVCPDCDGYEVRDRETIVMGSGDVGAHMAISLSYWTNKIVFVNDELIPVSHNLKLELDELGIKQISEKISKLITAEIGQFAGVELLSGTCIYADRAFIAYGGNEVCSNLASKLGAKHIDNGHIVTDPRTKMTSVPNLWVAGDIGIHSEMLSVAMAEGCISAVWMHKTLIKMGRGAKRP